MDQPPLDINVHTQGSLEDLYQQALSKVKGVSTQHNNKNVASLKSSSHPSYIEAGSLHAKRWMQTHERSKLVSISFLCIATPDVTWSSYIAFILCS